MTAVVFTSGADLSLARFRAWSAFTHTWQGWDGSAWDISTGASGVVLNAGVRGMGAPEETDYWQESPAISGGRWMGSIAERREVFWPLEVFHTDSTADWLDLDTRLWRTFDRRRPGRWTVSNPITGQSRSLSLRFKDDGQFAPDIDPALTGWNLYAITFTAEQPYWEGDLITDTWGLSDTPRYFFGGGIDNDPQAGPPFYISTAKSRSTAKISNPGDVEAFPVWIIRGPCTSTTVGLGSRVIEAPVTLGSNEWLRIDTGAQTVLYGTGSVDPTKGTRRAPDGLGNVNFAGVPAASSVPLVINQSGNGSVTMELTPLYNRAW